MSRDEYAEARNFVFDRSAIFRRTLAANDGLVLVALSQHRRLHCTCGKKPGAERKRRACLKYRNVLPNSGFSPRWTYGETHGENQNTERYRDSFRRRRQPGLGAGPRHVRAGKPQGNRTTPGAVLQPKLFSRSGFRAALPETAFRMEHWEGQVEGRRPGAIAPPLQLMATVHRNSGPTKT